MVCRRRWRLLAVTLVAMTPALVLGAGAVAPSVATAVENLKTKTGRESVQAREDLLGLRPTSPVDLDQYATDLDGKLRANLSNPSNGDARLNTAILFAQLNTLAMDKALMEALASKDPSVRYWGAKGLGGAAISSKLKQVGSGPVVAALDKAAKAEGTSVVQLQILHGLVVYENLDGVLDSLDGLANWMQMDVPDKAGLDEIAAALNWAQSKGISSATAPQKERAANLAARLASFAAQQAVAYKASYGAIPTAYQKSFNDVINAGVDVIGGAKGSAVSRLDTSSPEMALISANALLGSDGRPGELQKTMPKVAVPARVGAAATSTAPATTTH